jgi:aryl-alcohol dehydrogenase-like predicted oxidoreductase
VETRRLGKTGHLSSVVTFGTFAIGALPQPEADGLIEAALARGVNHFDVAPTYAEAEQRLGDYLKRRPKPDLFISCKTQERERDAAATSLRRTLERLGRERFDLFQLHAVGDVEELDRCFAPGGAMEAIQAARDEGLVTHIGITGHGWRSAATHAEALRRFDFSTVMTSANLFMVQDPAFRRDWEGLLSLCVERDAGVHLLKATARIAWGDSPRSHGTWYRPLTEQADVDRAVAWALQQPITTICSAGDPRLFAAICDAAERYRKVTLEQQQELLLLPEYGDIFVEA